MTPVPSALNVATSGTVFPVIVGWPHHVDIESPGPDHTLVVERDQSAVIIVGRFRVSLVSVTGRLASLSSFNLYKGLVRRFYVKDPSTRVTLEKAKCIVRIRSSSQFDL